MSVSETRGAQIQRNQNMTDSTQRSQKPSYARVTEEVPIKREQAVVIDAVEGIPVKEYAFAVAALIGANNILYISKISQSKVCLYLNSTDIAAKLTDTHKKIKINNQLLEIRPLLSKSKRIIISNVPPVIPNSAIENKLSELNIVPKSQILRIRAGINDPGFTHILCFRRQMYVDPEDVPKIPESTQIEHEGTTYWIYLSAEKLTCFICKEEGHLAKHCKIESSDASKSTDNALQDSMKFPALTPLVQQSNEAVTLPPINNNPAEFKTPTTETHKRRASGSLTLSSSSSSAQLLSNDINTQNDNFKITVPPKKKILPVKQPEKRIRKETITEKSSDLMKLDITQNLQEADKYFKENAIEPCISIENLAQFLTESYGVRDVLPVADKFTTDTSALSGLLQSVTNVLSDHALKSRIKRLIPKLNGSTTPDNSITSDMSDFSDAESLT